MTIKIGELFAGYGGLGMGVQAVTGGEVAWFSEFDDAPSKILAHHWPDVPNHGDITLIDWSQVEPVDILTGGFPCQDVSLAGARKGLKDGTRSGLWSEFARAIAALKPKLVVIENVRGLLSAEASGPVESDPWGMGNGTAGPILRALGAVLGDLAELGYDAEWCGVRAADAGAPHGRYRIFILAHPRGSRFYGGSNIERDGRDSRVGSKAVDNARNSAASQDSAHSGSERFGQHPGESLAEETGTASGDLANGSRGWRIDRVGRKAPTDTCGIRGDEGDSTAGVGRESPDGAGVADEHRSRLGATQWGDYLPAIQRWEAVTSRPAPAPTNPDGRNGSHRLAAQFVEWMMGLPAGHVTQAGLTRNQQLKALGNGVVPQQATLAVGYLLNERVAA
jgi:DNA (cytosine-5)-methyltransferase 1